MNQVKIPIWTVSLATKFANFYHSVQTSCSCCQEYTNLLLWQTKTSKERNNQLPADGSCHIIPRLNDPTTNALRLTAISSFVWPRSDFFGCQHCNKWRKWRKAREKFSIVVYFPVRLDLQHHSFGWTLVLFLDHTVHSRWVLMRIPPTRCWRTWRNECRHSSCTYQAVVIRWEIST